MRRPVVDVPVVFVEEEVVFAHLGERHGGEVCGGEGGEEQIGFKYAALAGLVLGLCVSAMSYMIHCIAGKGGERQRQKRWVWKAVESGRRTCESCAHGLRVLAVSAKWLDFELGALKLADAELALHDWVKRCTGLPACWNGGERKTRSEDAPGGWTEGALECIHCVL